MADPAGNMEEFWEALVSRYQPLGQIGSGGMATIHLARDLRNTRDVALKVLRSDIAALLGAERFLAEIAVTARLSNPHILPLYDSGHAAGRLYYVMPFMEGASLRARLDREKQLPIEDAVAIARDVAAALSYAHDHGIIHRDVKPENILLSGGEAVVADFGIARAVTVAGGDRLTETGLTVGTPEYMSPEQASGERDLDGRSDIYALGCVLYEMLTGSPPLVGATAQATLARRFAETPASVRIVRETVSAELEAVVQKALAKVPADRFASSRQLAEALRTSGGYATGSGAPAVAVDRAPPRKVARGLPRALVLLGAVVALTVSAALLLRRPSRAGLDANLLMVAPFDVLDPQLELWREGLVDLLSASLDGAGSLRAVPPSTVVRRWNGRADLLTASRFAGDHGASLAVYGRVVQAGHDSVRLTASLLDVVAGRAMADYEFRGLASRIDELADSLALHTLAEVNRSRPLGAERMSSIGSRSPPAVKAFLQGEQLLRRMSLDSARVQYQRAIDLDSTFALAFNRMGLTLTWLPGEQVHEQFLNEQFLKAGSLSRGLALRESMLVAADSLRGSLGSFELSFAGDSASWSRLSRLFATLERVTELYRDDVGAWYSLGEARSHWGTSKGFSFEEALLPFEQVVRLDSGFVPAHPHLVEWTLAAHGIEAGRKAFQTLRSYPTSAAQVSSSHLAMALLHRDDADATVIERLLDTLPASAIINSTPWLWQVADSGEAAITVARAYAIRPPGFDSTTLGFALAHRGHATEAWRTIAPGAFRLTGQGRLLQSLLLSELALMGTVPPDTAAAVFASWLGWWRRTHLGLAWWHAVGDTLSLARVTQAANAAIRRGSLPATDTAFVGYTRNVALAYLTLARGDSVEALRRLRGLPPWPCVGCYRERLTIARLLAASGQRLEAARLLKADPGLSFPGRPGNVFWILERARIHDQLGHRERAARDYSYVADIWRHADPELQRFVEEARAALTRLAAEPR